MIIKSINNEYEVIHVSYSSESYDVFICKTLGEVSKSKQIVCMKGKRVIPTLIPHFLDLSESGAFEAFHESFVNNEKLYVVFDYFESKEMVKALRYTIYSLEERIKIGKALLEYVILSNIPEFILYDVLSDENLQLDDTLSVTSAFKLDALARHGLVEASVIRNRICEWIEIIFKEELVNENNNDVEELIKTITAMGGFNKIEIYRSFIEFTTELESKKELFDLDKETFIHKVIEKVKSYRKYVKPVLTVTICVATILYLIFTTFIEPDYLPGTGSLEKIGTVEVPAYKE